MTEKIVTSLMKINHFNSKWYEDESNIEALINLFEMYFSNSELYKINAKITHISRMINVSNFYLSKETQNVIEILLCQEYFNLFFTNKWKKRQRKSLTEISYRSLYHWIANGCKEETFKDMISFIRNVKKKEES